MKMTGKQIWTVILTGAICFALVACGVGASNSKSKASADTEMQQMASDEIFYSTNGSVAGGVLYDAAPETDGKESPASGSSVYRDNAVKLIRRASLTVQTTEFEQAIAALERLVIRLEGYYENAELRGGSYYNQQSSRSGSYTIRIPAARYDEFMQQVGGIGYLARKNESSEDVGEAYHDIETRLKTQRTKQDRLLELLKSAKNMEDIISLENALTEVEYLIEQYTTDLNRYDGLVSYATIHLSLDEMVRIVDEPGERAGLLARMKAGVVSSADGLVNGIQNTIVWVTYNLFGLLFFALAVAVSVVFGRRYIKKRKHVRQESTEQAEQ